MMRLLFYAFVGWARLPVTGLDVRDQTRDWTAKDVKGNNSFDKASENATIVL
jgi:hypothetical protein